MSSPQPSMRPGRNDPCPCGSGRKYKRCCLSKESGAPTDPLLKTLTPEERASIQWILSTRGEAGLDEANAVVQHAMERHNRAPQAELGGLSPTQVASLIYMDWSSDEGPIGLATDLMLDELRGAGLLLDARVFLTAVERKEGIPTTQAGNLPRSFVAEMLERLELEPKEVELLRRRNTVLNEGDVFPLLTLRILLELAGLLRKYRKRFVVTRRARELLTEARAGELFAHLFRTQFGTMNLAYFDGVESKGEFQQGVPFSLYRFGTVGGEWWRPEELVELLLLPIVRSSIPEGPAHVDLEPLVLRTRFLEILARFGLADTEETSGGLPWRPRLRYRKTPLFDRLLTFRLGD